VATLGAGECIADNLFLEQRRRWCLKPVTPLELLLLPREAFLECVRPTLRTEQRELALTRAAFFTRNLAAASSTAASVKKTHVTAAGARGSVKGARTWNWHTDSMDVNDEYSDEQPHDAQLYLLRGMTAADGASSSAGRPWSSSAQRRSRATSEPARTSSALPSTGSAPTLSMTASRPQSALLRPPSASPSQPQLRPPSASTSLVRAQSAVEIGVAQRRPQSAGYLLGPPAALRPGGPPLSPWSGAAHFATKTSSRPATLLAAADGCRTFGQLTLKDALTGSSSLAPSKTTLRIVRYVPNNLEGDT